jgi:starch synthase
MRVLYVTSEALPLAKTGGLADVSAALPAALSDLGVDVRLLLPAYPQALEAAPSPREVLRTKNLLGYGEARLLETYLPASQVRVWLLDCPELYNRSGGLYLDEDGQEWSDNPQRFAALAHVAAAIGMGALPLWQPDIVHGHDWHAGLVPFLLQGQDSSRPATVQTVHNLAFLGQCDMGLAPQLGLGDAAAVQTHAEFYGRLSFLKAGISTADAITTVSANYAREILTPEYGCGLDGLLQARANRLHGILNGMDDAIWNPETDPHLPHCYSKALLAPKAICKALLQREMGLPENADVPLLASMSRLAHQKMPDVVLEVLPALLEQGVQFVLLGDGDRTYRDQFLAMAARYPGQMAVRIGYQEPLAHRILGGADMLMHPSRFEPCGLVPIYAMRYGTIPLVRKIGGMADSVVDATPETILDGSATGFSFTDPDAASLLACAQRAIALYSKPLSWRKLQAAAMSRDFSWRRSAQIYADLYHSLVPGLPIEEADTVSAQKKLTA